MARKPDVSQYETFDQITERLNGIVDAVRDREISLERSLDLFDEAIALGSKAVEMVDATSLTDAEKARLEGEGEAAAETAGAPETAPEAEAAEPEAPAGEA